MLPGPFSQEAPGVGTSFWESIPTSIQTIVGVAAIMGAAWTWFVRPRMTALVAEAFARGHKEWCEALAATRDELRGDFSARIDRCRDELRSEIAENRDKIVATRDELRSEIDASRQELRGEIDATHQDLSAKIAATRHELRSEIDRCRDELHSEIVATRKDLSARIVATRDELHSAITGNRDKIGTNRDSIVGVREMISASRIETRDLIAEMQRENHLAHAAIGERINVVQTEVAALRTDSARLAGAVDILTAVVRGDPDQGETWAP